MADLWLQNTKKEEKMYSDCRDIPVLWEIGVAEYNGVFRIAAGSSEMAVSAHVQ